MQFFIIHIVYFKIYMTYYLLPRTSFLLHKNIDYISSDDPPNVMISDSLSNYLYDIKEKIDKYGIDWDTFKKYTNPYEYIHSIPPYRKKSVSRYKPLSRSYFKMLEMLNIFNVEFGKNPIQTFHLAEGPGGFIEAIRNVRNCPDDKYIGMTILDDQNDPNIPAWKKSDTFLKNNPNIIIETGADNTGNILHLDNFAYCKEKYSSSMNLITADGGFDFSSDFNNQELSITNLLFAQIAFAIIMQKKDGTFILKLFDIFMEHTVGLLYLLSSLYEKVYITKPQTSRYANSEKYLVCKGFIYSNNSSLYPILYNAFEKMLAMPSDKYIKGFFSTPISYYFLSKLEEYNSIFGQQQIENIYYTISLLENKHKQDKIEGLIKINTQKCIHWCIKNNIEYNNYNITNEEPVDP